MTQPKLLASQELSLHRVNIQQQSFTSHFSSLDSSTNNNSSSSISNANISVGSFPRVPPSRSELTSPLTTGSMLPGVPPFPSNKSLTPSLGPLTGAGANSTAPASIARPEIRSRVEWSSALEDIDLFVLPDHQLHCSTVNTGRKVIVQYIADQYDRHWLAQRSVTTIPTTTLSKGKAGGFDSTTTSASSVPTATRHDISISLFEDLITAFEVGSYNNPEIPVQRQPVSSFESVISTGADITVVEEVRRYWLGKRQALGGNVPCIPALRMNVREDNQSLLCHSDLLQYCPLPFNDRDASTPVMLRRTPRNHKVNTIVSTEVNNNINNTENSESLGCKRKRCDSEKAIVIDDDTAEAELKEMQALASCTLKVALAVLEREESKLAHTHLALYELATLRSLALMEREALEGEITSSVQTPCVNDKALQEEWTGDNLNTEDFLNGMGGRVGAAALESVMAIGKRLC